MQITSTVIEDVTYYTMISRGVTYTLNKYGKQWALHSQRNALGRGNVGSYKFFNTLQEVESKLKAFVGISQLLLV